MVRNCKKHGEVRHRSRGKRGWRCTLCANESVSNSRRKIKRILVEEHGSACKICGYNRCIAALHFHHVDPETKSFGVAAGGSARSLKRAREEAAKCVLLCSNCHAEIEAGITSLWPNG